MADIFKECVPKQTDTASSVGGIYKNSQKSASDQLKADHDGNGCHICFLSQHANNAKGNILNDRTESYHCGVCSQTFCTICCLHNHLTTYHLLSGSYHYDYFIQTAFPKYESLCQFTQTEDLDFNREGVFDIGKQKRTYGSSDALKRKSKVQSRNKSRTKGNAQIESSSTQKALGNSDLTILKDVKTEREDFIQYENTINSSDEIDDNYSDRTDDYFESGENLYSDIETEEVSSRSTVISQEIDLEKHCGVRKKTSIKRKSKTDDSVYSKKRDHLSGLGRMKVSKLISDTHNKDKIGANDVSIKSARQKCNKKNKTEKNANLIKQENQDWLKDYENSDTFVNSLSELPVNITGPKEVKDKQDEDVLTKKVDKTEGNKCDVCGATFTVKQGLLRHEQQKHSDLMKFHCEQCDKKFMRAFNLQKHVIRVHGGKKGSGTKVEQDEEYSTLQCKDELDISLEVTPEKMQSNSVTDKEGVVCGDLSETGEAKTTRRKRRTNEEMKSMKAPHTCEICGHTMPRSKMDVHQRLHTGLFIFIYLFSLKLNKVC